MTIALTLSLSKARFEELNMGYFQNSTGRVEKYLGDGENAIFLLVVTHIMQKMLPTICRCFETTGRSRIEQIHRVPQKTFMDVR